MTLNFALCRVAVKLLVLMVWDLMCSAPQNVNGDWLFHETHVKYQETLRNIGYTLKQMRNSQIMVSLGKGLPKATVNMILARLALLLFPFIILGNSHLN